MQTLLTNENKSYKREHRAKYRTLKLQKMKKKIISCIATLLFIGAVAFNMQIVNSNNQTSEVTLENIEAMASGSSYPYQAWRYCGWNDLTWACIKEPTATDCYQYVCLKDH